MASLKKHIDEKCKQCTYDPAQPGGWRSQTENCTVYSCALWPVRPVTIETVRLNRKTRGPDGIDLDALVNGLDDEEDTESSTEVKVAA